MVVLKGPSFVEVASKGLLGLVGLLGEEYNLGCLAVHHPGQWSHQRAACSTPRHYRWPVASDGG